MIQFAHPEHLTYLFALPVLAVVLWSAWMLRRRKLNAYGDRKMLQRMIPGRSRVKFWLRGSLFIVAAATLIVAYANPKVGTKFEEVTRSGIDLIVAIDVSSSMRAEDIQPDRISAAKKELQNLINNLKGDRIGIIVFAGDGYTQLPLTSDYNAALMLTDVITTGSAPTPGTAIGSAIALRLAQEGYNIVVNYRSSNQEAEKLCKQIEAMGGACHMAQADVSQFNEAEKLVKETTATYGRLDVLVNNAGITSDGLWARMKQDDIDRVLDVNLKGCLYTMRHAARPMCRQKSGVIINISSVVGLTGNVGQVNYAASKAGIIGATKAAARELGTWGIRVNAIAPGYVDTDMSRDVKEEYRQAMVDNTILKRVGKPEEIAAAAAFLSSDDAAYITGQVLVVDGGMVL